MAEKETKKKTETKQADAATKQPATETKPEAKVEAKKESKPEAKTEAKPETKTEAKPAAEAKAKPTDSKTAPATATKAAETGTEGLSEFEAQKKLSELITGGADNGAGNGQAVEPPKDLTAPPKGKVFYATGRRKTSAARVFMQGGKGSIKINGNNLEEYFPLKRVQNMAFQPLRQLKGESLFDFHITVRGGGLEGQAGAIRHGLARALLKYDEELKRFLHKKGYLTRDPRSVERKKVGLHKARKSPQYSKR